MGVPPRDKLLEVGTELFSERGFAAVSIRELAQAAGTNSAMISYYFGGKEGLYREVLESQFSTLVRTMKESIGDSPDPLKSFRALGEALFMSSQKLPCWLRLYYGELSCPSPAFDVVEKHIREVADIGAGIVQTGIRQNDFRADVDPRYASLALAGTINYFFLVRRLAEKIGTAKPGKDEEFVDQTVRIFLDGLRNRR